MNITLRDEELGVLEMDCEMTDYNEARRLLSVILLWVSFAPCQIDDIIGKEGDDSQQT